MINIFSIALLITCHNRKQKTLRCLKTLFDQNGLNKQFTIEIFLVDDACIDGTSNRIRSLYPEVNILQGDGNLFWNRGMHLAWETAALAKNYDYYLWLNDDTFLFNNAFEILFSEVFSKSIVCGVTRASMNENATYGGYLFNQNKVMHPNGSYQDADYCNGNCVLIPKYVFNNLGNLDPVFHHALGDFDYSLRAKKNGIEIKLTPEFVGICDRHENVPEWQSTSISITKRLKYLYSPQSGCSPLEFFVFDIRHFGLFNAFLHFFSIHIRLIFPNLWRDS